MTEVTQMTFWPYKLQFKIAHILMRDLPVYGDKGADYGTGTAFERDGFIPEIVKIHSGKATYSFNIEY